MTSADYPSTSTSNPRRKDEKGKQVLQPGTPSNGRPLRHRSAFEGPSLSSKHCGILVARSYIAHADFPLLQACSFPHEVAPSNCVKCKSSVSKACKLPLSKFKANSFHERGWTGAMQGICIGGHRNLACSNCVISSAAVGPFERSPGFSAGPGHHSSGLPSPILGSPFIPRILL